MSTAPIAITGTPSPTELTRPIVEPQATTYTPQFYVPNFHGHAIMLAHVYDSLVLNAKLRFLEAQASQLEFVTFGLYCCLYRLLKTSNEVHPLPPNVRDYFLLLDQFFTNVSVPNFLAQLLGTIGSFHHSPANMRIYSRFPNASPVVNRQNGIWNIHSAHLLPNFHALFRAIRHQFIPTQPAVNPPAYNPWNINFLDSAAIVAPPAGNIVHDEYWKFPGLTTTPTLPTYYRHRQGIAMLPNLLAATPFTIPGEIFLFHHPWMARNVTIWLQVSTALSGSAIIRDIPNTVENYALNRVTITVPPANPGLDDDRWTIVSQSEVSTTGVTLSAAIGFLVNFVAPREYLLTGANLPLPGTVTLSQDFPLLNRYSVGPIQPLSAYPAYAASNT